MADQIIGGWNEISQRGDIADFYRLIKNNNVKLLEQIDELPFVHTPLHTSAVAGQIEFSIEMMKLKPSFISKPNADGHTPIYLALLNGHTELVRQLLQRNVDLVRVKGRECMTPLHDAATNIGREDPRHPQYDARKQDYLALLENFLSVCPHSITDLTVRNETALHIALKNKNLDAFKFLVGWLLRKWPDWRKILEQKNVKGNTVLHIAVLENQTLAVSHLLACGGIFVYINEKNLDDNTALDILEGQLRHNNEMRAILDRAGALTASALPTVTSSYAHYLMPPKIYERVIIPIGRQLEEMTDERRSALLVVAALLVTVTYQAIITPPGGLWQDDHFKYNTTDVLRRSPDELFKLNITAPHRAGSATAMRSGGVFGIFLFFNSIIFLSTIASLAILVPPDGFVGAILAVFSLYLCYGYFSSLMIITQASERWFAKAIIGFSPLYVYIVGAALIIGSYWVTFLVDRLKLHGKRS